MRGLVRFLAFVAVVVGIAVGITAYRAREFETSPGGPDSAWWVDADGRRLLVLSDRVSFGGRSTRARLTVVDARDGTRLATRVFDREWLTCLPAVAGRLWCRQGAVELLDARTLAPVSTVEGLGAVDQERVAITADAAFGLTPDGRVNRLDARTLQVSPSTTAAMEKAYSLLAGGQPRQADCQLERTTTWGGAGFRFEGSPRATLVAGDRRGVELLEPAFLLLEPGASLAGPLVVHAESMAADAATSVSLVSPEGTLRWTAPLPGRCQLAGVVDGVIAVASTAGASRARGIRAADGTIVWTLSFPP